MCKLDNDNTEPQIVCQERTEWFSEIDNAWIIV